MIGGITSFTISSRRLPFDLPADTMRCWLSRLQMEASRPGQDMHIYPAIDLLHGKCVRLRQGDYSRETVFSDDPVSIARRWVEFGADRLHVVDLDGARRKAGERRHYPKDR